MRYTLQDVLDFAWKHRGRRCFKDMDYSQVGKIILLADKYKNLRVVADEEGICGVVITRIDDKVVFVDFLVAVRNGFATFIEYLKLNFPNHELWAERKGRTVKLNTRILCQRLRQAYRTLTLTAASTSRREAQEIL